MEGGLAHEAPHVCNRAMHTIARTRTRTSPIVGPLRGSDCTPTPLIPSKHVLSLDLNQQGIYALVILSAMLDGTSFKHSYHFKNSIIFRDCTAPDLSDGYVQIDQDNLVTHTARYGFFRC